jgi:Lar family restriction alleviation protein
MKTDMNPNPPAQEAQTLLPCPFCGGQASVPRNIGGPRSAPRWYIYCLDKNSSHPALRLRVDAATEDVAIAAWNTRTGTAALVAALEGLLGCISETHGKDATDAVYEAIRALADVKGG